MSPSPNPTLSDLGDVADRLGYTIDGYESCPIQGVLIAYSRPTRPDESLLGLPVAGPRVASEITERHFCPEFEAPPEVQVVTRGRAVQRAIWAMEAEDREVTPDGR